MLRQDRRRRLPERARLGLHRDLRDAPLRIQLHIHFNSGPTHARDFQRRSLRIGQMPDMRDIRRQLQDAIVIQVTEHGRYVGRNAAGIKG